MFLLSWSTEPHRAAKVDVVFGARRGLGHVLGRQPLLGANDRFGQQPGPPVVGQQGFDSLDSV